MTAEQYKSCPFCGSKAERADCIGCGYVMIRCPACDAGISVVLRNQNPETIREADAELIRRWNRRVSENG